MSVFRNKTPVVEKRLKESSNITETPGKEKGEMIGLTPLPPRRQKET